MLPLLPYRLAYRYTQIQKQCKQYLFLFPLFLNLYQLDNIEKQVGEIHSKIDKHSDRLSALENFRYLLMGAVAVISALTTYLISKFKGLN